VPAAHGETVTRLRAAAVVAPYSQTAEDLDWTHVDELAVDDCVLYPAGASAEQVDVGRDQAVQTLTLLAPAGTDLTPLDRVRARGATYDVDGWPFEYRSPLTGWRPGVQVNLVRRAG
jgi:hypothetical protein